MDIHKVHLHPYLFMNIRIDVRMHLDITVILGSGSVRLPPSVL